MNFLLICDVRFTSSNFSKNDSLLFGNVAYTITLLEIVEVVSTIAGGVYQISFYKI